MCKVGGPRCEDKLSHAERAERLAEQAARRRARRAELKQERERLEHELNFRGVPTNGLTMTGLAAVSRAYGVDSTVTVKQGMLSDADRAALPVVAGETIPVPDRPATGPVPEYRKFTAFSTDTLTDEFEHLDLQGKRSLHVYPGGQVETERNSFDSLAPEQGSRDPKEYAWALTTGTEDGWTTVPVPGNGTPIDPGCPNVFVNDGTFPPKEAIQEAISNNGPGQYEFVPVNSGVTGEMEAWALAYKPNDPLEGKEIKLGHNTTGRLNNSRYGISVDSDGYETYDEPLAGDYTYVDLPPKQDDFASAEEFEKQLREGYNGWTALTGEYANPTTDQDIKDLVKRHGPGQYARMEFHDDEGNVTGAFLARRKVSADGGRATFDHLAETEKEFINDEYFPAESGQPRGIKERGGLDPAFRADNLSGVSYRARTRTYMGGESPRVFYERHILTRGAEKVLDAASGRNIRASDFEQGSVKAEAAHEHARTAAVETVYRTPQLAADMTLGYSNGRSSALSDQAKALGILSTNVQADRLDDELREMHRPREAAPTVQGKRFDVDKAFPVKDGYRSPVLCDYMGVEPSQLRSLSRPGVQGKYNPALYASNATDYVTSAPGVSEAVSTATAAGIMDNLSYARNRGLLPEEVGMAVHNKAMELHTRRATDPDTPFKLAQLAQQVDEKVKRSRAMEPTQRETLWTSDMFVDDK